MLIPGFQPQRLISLIWTSGIFFKAPQVILMCNQWWKHCLRLHLTNLIIMVIWLFFLRGEKKSHYLRACISTYIIDTGHTIRSQIHVSRGDASLAGRGKDFITWGWYFWRAAILMQSFFVVTRRVSARNNNSVSKTFFVFCFFYKFIYLFILAVLVFVSVWGLSPVLASRGHPSSRCTGLSLPRPLPLRSTGSRRAGSVVVAHGPSRSAACGIFPDQGPNPCAWHWQADSQPLRH